MSFDLYAQTSFGTYAETEVSCQINERLKAVDIEGMAEREVQRQIELVVSKVFDEKFAGLKEEIIKYLIKAAAQKP